MPGRSLSPVVVWRRSCVWVSTCLCASHISHHIALVWMRPYIDAAHTLTHTLNSTCQRLGVAIRPVDCSQLRRIHLLFFFSSFFFSFFLPPPVTFSSGCRRRTQPRPPLSIPLSASPRLAAGPGHATSVLSGQDNPHHAMAMTCACARAHGRARTGRTRCGPMSPVL